jgi:hypothetical protein
LGLGPFPFVLIKCVRTGHLCPHLHTASRRRGAPRPRSEWPLQSEGKSGPGTRARGHEQGGAPTHLAPERQNLGRSRRGAGSRRAERAGGTEQREVASAATPGRGPGPTRSDSEDSARRRWDPPGARGPAPARRGAGVGATRTEPLALQGPDQLPAAAEGATRPQCTCTCRAPAPPRGPPTWLGSCHHVWRDTPRARFLLRDHTRAAHVPTLPPPRWARRPPRVAPRARLSRVHAAARSPHVAWLMPSRAARRTARALSVRYVT